MNRQQRRAMEREREKNVNKMLKQRKAMPLGEKEAKRLKAVEWTLGLSKEEQELLMEFCNESSKRDLELFQFGLDIVLNENLNHDIKLITKIYDDLILEGNKTRECMEKGENYMKKIEENRGNIIEDYKRLKEENRKENEIVKDLVFKYNLTNNAIKNVITQYKRNLKKEEEEKEIEDAVNYIFEDEIKKEETKEPVKEVPNGKYEVLEEQIIIKRTIKGEYGTYKIDNKVMTIDDFAFCKKEEVEQACSEKLIELQREKERIEKAMKEAEESKNEAIEIMEMYMGV